MQSAYRMQFAALDAFDVRTEPETIREEYGTGQFANGCLLARRLVERGVRCVHVGSGGWDDHKDLEKNYRKNCPAMDQAAATLIRDLHATILYALGMDHTKLNYCYAGRDFRLTDVSGEGMTETMRDLNNTTAEFDKWRMATNGTGYRLPSEAEWEFACRAGTSTEFCSGSNSELLRKWAVNAGNAQSPFRCGSKLPNGWGLFDMHGNVWEWCYDWFAEFREHDETDPTGPSEPSFGEVSSRVYRGRSWSNVASRCRSAYGWRTTDDRFRNYGIRLALGPALRHVDTATRRSADSVNKISR